MTNDNASHIEYDKNGDARAFIGPDAVAMYAAATLASALGLYLKSGIKASRFHTPGNMAAAATRITGKPYKSSTKGLTQAEADVRVWVQTMKAALPAVTQGERQ